MVVALCVEVDSVSKEFMVGWDLRAYAKCCAYSMNEIVTVGQVIRIIDPTTVVCLFAFRRGIVYTLGLNK